MCWFLSGVVPLTFPLAVNPLGVEGARAIANGVRHCPLLEGLWMFGECCTNMWVVIDLGGKGLALVFCPPSFPCFVVVACLIPVAETRMGDEGAVCVADAIAHCPALEDINVDSELCVMECNFCVVGFVGCADWNRRTVSPGLVLMNFVTFPPLSLLQRTRSQAQGLANWPMHSPRG